MIFKLIAPWWVLVILFTPVVVFILWRCWLNRKNSLRWSWLRRLTIVALLVLIALRPSFPGGSAPQGMSAFDVYFVVDTTSSMVAEDYDGDKPRLEGVKQDIKELAAQMAGARFSMITFNSTSYVEMPLTTDATALLSISSTLQQEVTYYSAGSTISQPVETLQKELEKNQKAYPERQSIVYFMSDGEQTSDRDVGSFESLKQYVTSGVVMGYGTTSGGKMKEFLGYGDKDRSSYIKDYSGSTYPTPDAISKLDESNLQTIAQQMGVTYVHRDTPGGIEAITTQLNLAKLASDKQSVDTYWDTYWILAIGLYGLVLWEIWSLRRVLRDARRERNLS